MDSQSVTDTFAAYGPWGLVGFTVLAVLRGWLMPRSIVDDLRTELAYTRERLKELEAQRNVAWAEAAKIGVALAHLPSIPPRDTGAIL